MFIGLNRILLSSHSTKLTSFRGDLRHKNHKNMKKTWKKNIERALRGFEGSTKRSLTIPFEDKFELTRTEYLMMNFWIWQMHARGRDKLPVLIPISERFHLDFIGWDRPEYYDVMLCKNAKGNAVFRF